MEYGNVFKNSGRLIWRHKLLWVLGLFLISGSLPGLAVGHLYARFLASLPTNLLNAATTDDFFEPLLNVVLNPAVVFGGAGVFFLVFIVVWLLGTIGEAALIRSVADFDDGRSLSFGEMFSAGTKLLVRFIAIDTVIFLPLFLILLIQMLIVGSGLIGSILFLAKSGSNPEEMVPIAFILGLIFIVLSVIAVPILLATMLVRLLAFRSAALEDLRTRPSIRRAWQLIKGKIGEIAIVFLLLYAVSYGVGIVSSLLLLPFTVGGSLFLIRPFMEGQLPQQGQVDAFVWLISLASIINLIPGLLYRVFSSAVWTLAYRQWQPDWEPGGES
jgi:hypothetical protein